MNENTFENIDEYIALFDENIQEKLKTIRAIISKNAPNTIEVISYKMPAFKQNRVLVYFAAYKNHIGFYPTASGIKQFENEFLQLGLQYSKGAVQFPLNKKLPEKLIAKMVKFRVDEVAMLKK